MFDSLREPWLRGIAFNSAGPSDVLARLLDRVAGEAGLLMCEGRDLPDAVIDAALRHPAGVIRRALARNRYVDPARLAPLATDPSGIVRGWLAAGPRHYPRWVRPLPDDVLVTLLTAKDGGEDGKGTPVYSVCPCSRASADPAYRVDDERGGAHREDEGKYGVVLDGENDDQGGRDSCRHDFGGQRETVSRSLSWLSQHRRAQMVGGMGMQQDPKRVTPETTVVHWPMADTNR
ncbi:hypothetical protein [Streptomyces sp. NPDC102437]|uniref:hypothetical protein n=1 Tax=Streptomyces sp. NPDC102437 TaxID=3366175 RepID=UPI00381F7178